MGALGTLLGSTEFLFGATLLCAFQVRKFGEVDDDLKDQVAVPNLGARDFLGHVSYYGVVTLFVAVSLAGYTLLCLASPALVGWVKVTSGAVDAAAVDKIAQSSYPLWIAAGFMGLAHQAIPGLKNIANIQRDVFHDLIGVPRYVVDTAFGFSSQILAAAGNDRDALSRRLGELCDEQWRNGIESIADIRFFEAGLKRLNLESEKDLKEALEASRRELRTWLRQVVYLACIATVRKSGGRGLAELADALRVEKRDVGSLWDLALPALCSAGILLVLLFVVPSLADRIAALVGHPVDDLFWPHAENLGPGDDGPIMQTAIYLLGQVLPVLIAAAILASSPLRRMKIEAEAAAKPRLEGLLVENAGAYAAIVGVVFAYSCGLTLWDYGRHRYFKFDGFLPFLENQALYFLVQALIALAICLVIQRRSVEGLGASTGRRLLDGGLVVAVAAALSTFYGWARLEYAFEPPRTLDFVLLVVILNATAAAIAFVGCQSVWRRRQARAEHRKALSSLAPAVPAPAAPPPPVPAPAPVPRLAAAPELDPMTVD